MFSVAYPSKGDRDILSFPIAFFLLILSIATSTSFGSIISFYPFISYYNDVYD